MKIEVTKRQAKMLESMPQEVTIIVMLSLAMNLICMKKGELKNPSIPDNPIELITQMAAMITIKGIVREMDAEDAKIKADAAIEKAKG